MTAIDQSAVSKLDFFSEIVNVHWPAKEGRLLATITSTVTVDGTVQPSCVVPTFDKAVLDRSERCTKTTVPSHVVNTTFFIIWSGGAPFPDSSNYNNPVGPNIGIQPEYANQFALTVNFGAGFHSPPDPTPFGGSGGYFPSLAQASAYAAVWNAAFSAEIIQEWYNSDGTVGGPAGKVPAVAGSFVVPVTIPATSTAAFRGLYLFRIINDLETMTASLTGSDSGTANGKTYHQKVNKISQLRGSPDHEDDSSRVGDTDYHFDTFPLGTTPKTWDVHIRANSHVEGGG